MLSPRARRPTVRPQPKTRVQRLSDWGIGMSICIAAIADDGRTIVTVSDRLYSWGNETSGDGRVKTELIHRSWGVMLAGDEVRRLEPMIGDAYEHLRTIKAPTLDDVGDALRRGWRDAQRQLIESELLSPYGYDRPDFLARGRHELGDSKFSELVADLAILGNLQCELLVYGFDEQASAQLLALTGKGELLNCSRPGFMAIGSGAHTAIDAMLQTDYKIAIPYQRAIYQTCHAKFMSERALGVGRNTLVVGLTHDGRLATWDTEQVDPIREKWSLETRPTIPIDAEAVVPEAEWEDASGPAAPRSPRRSTRGRKRQPPSPE